MEAITAQTFVVFANTVIRPVLIMPMPRRPLPPSRAILAHDWQQSLKPKPDGIRWDS